MVLDEGIKVRKGGRETEERGCYRFGELSGGRGGVQGGVRRVGRLIFPPHLPAGD